MTLTRLDRRDEARTTLEASAVLTRETGQPQLEAHALAALGQLCRIEARPERAVEYFERSLALRRTVGDRIGEGWMLHRLAEARTTLGEPDSAREAATAAARVAAESQDATLDRGVWVRRWPTRLIARGGAQPMPRYLIERSVPGLTRDELTAAGRRSVAVLADLRDVRWIRSYVSDAEGKIYCEYDAPDVEAIREHARRAGLPVDRITEIALEINPAMFV